MAKDTLHLPTDATQIAAAKHRLGMKSTVVGAGSNIEVYVKRGPAGTHYHGKPELVYRPATNPALPASKQSSRRRKLAACKNKRGCDFANCAKEALGHIPTNLAKACGPTGMGVPRLQRMALEEV